MHNGFGHHQMARAFRAQVAFKKWLSYTYTIENEGKTKIYQTMFIFHSLINGKDNSKWLVINLQLDQRTN